MSLGETIDREIQKHLLARGLGHFVDGCEFCGAMVRVRKAYEEMMHELNVATDLPDGEPITPRALTGTFTQNRVSTEPDETYESVLPRDPDFEKEEAA